MIFLQLNEINLDYVRRYSRKFAGLTVAERMVAHSRTLATEAQYALLEPWIQWPSIHYGQPFSEHRMFHLDSINLTGAEDIYTRLADEGLVVNCLSLMNLNLKSSRLNRYVPDPWSSADPGNHWTSRYLHEALKQAVNDNAKQRVSLKSAFQISTVILTNIGLKSLLLLVSKVAKLRSTRYGKALVLDWILTILTVEFHKKDGAHLSALFLNGMAHIQHHYMLSSAVSCVTAKNPSWYSKPDSDPMLDALIEYQDMIQYLETEISEPILIASGLTQEPYTSPMFYYRLKNHEEFFQAMGFKFDEIIPLMTRDMIIKTDQPLDEVRKMLSAITLEEKPMFGHFDKTQQGLFCSLIYQDEIKDDDNIAQNGNVRFKAKEHTIFIAIKNGHHSETCFLSHINFDNKDLIQVNSITELSSAIFQLLRPSK